MPYNDPMDAAQRKLTFGYRSSAFPAVGMLLADERSDLSRDIENTFYGGGHAPNPSPTPSPASPPHWWQFWKGGTPTPSPAPTAVAGGPRPWMGDELSPMGTRRTMSADQPVSSRVSATEMAVPPSQIPFRQLPMSRSEMEMQKWYENLVQRYLARPDVQNERRIGF
jgi:hypothetical protein